MEVFQVRIPHTALPFRSWVEEVKTGRNVQNPWGVEQGFVVKKGDREVHSAK